MWPEAAAAVLQVDGKVYITSQRCGRLRVSHDRHLASHLCPMKVYHQHPSCVQSAACLVDCYKSLTDRNARAVEADVQAGVQATCRLSVQLRCR